MKQSAWQGPIRGSNPADAASKTTTTLTIIPSPRPLSGVFRPPDYTSLG